jgi:hypothetical protein
MNPKNTTNKGCAVGGILTVAAAALFATTTARGVDFHVATAQDLQNALTLAAANGADDNIYLANGYYVGSFNFNSTEARNLTLLPEPGLTNTDITIDGAGGGRALNLSSSAIVNTITVQGITFLRNCGNKSIGALRIGAGTSATIVVNGCRFLSPTNSSGMGLEIASGQNATIRCCAATGAAGSDGRAFYINATGTILVQGNTISSNTNSYGLNYFGAGINVNGATTVSLTGNVIVGNDGSPGWCVGGGANISASGYVNVSSNIFANNKCYSGMDPLGGGGLYVVGAATASIVANTFSGNIGDGNDTDRGSGGGLCVSGCGTTLIQGNNFNTNRAAHGYGGGGASVNGGAVTLNNNAFTGNVGGGAFINYASTSVAMSNNTFTSNSSTSTSGGGAYCYPAATLAGNTFVGNSAPSGGGAYCASTATLTGNAFSVNSASSGSGGGAYCGSTATLTGNTFKQNAASISGGGIYASGSTITISDNLLTRNTVGIAGTGGGIWVNASAVLYFINNTITANSSSGNGGGVAFQVSGGVELLNVFNNIIWGNTASGSGGDVILGGTGQKKLFNFNDVDSMSGVWDIALNNIDVAPQFFDPVNGDYHIQSTSPCKDAGTNGAPSLPSTDLDGNSRTNSSGLVDMGCYEFNITATHPADTNSDFVLTADEFNAYAAAWKSGQGWTNGPSPISADYVTRAGYLMTNGGTYTNDGSARPTNWKPRH